MILANQAHAALAAWRDRLTALAVAIVACAALKGWLASRTYFEAAIILAGAGAGVGFTAERLISARLRFHAFDGAFAEDAARQGPRLRYMGLWHLAALAAIGALAIVARPTLGLVALPGYLAGALAGYAGDVLFEPRRLGRGAPIVRAAGARLRQPAAGALAALAVLALLLATRGMEPGDRLAIAGVLGAVAGLLLTTLDDAAIRYLTVSGRGSWAIVGIHSRSVLIFAPIAILACLASSAPAAAGVIGAVAALCWMLMALRILAYRLYTKRLAETIVTAVAGLIGVTAVAAPFLAPLVLAAALWQLHRRSAGRTWLLA
jgi:hypothetical protein